MLLGSFASVQYILLQMNKMIPPVTGPYRWASSKGHLCFFLQNKLPGNSAIYPDKDHLLFLRRIKCKIRNHCFNIPIHYLILIIPRCLSFIYHERHIREFFFLVKIINELRRVYVLKISQYKSLWKYSLFI